MNPEGEEPQEAPDEDSPAKAPRPPVPASQARAGVQDPRELPPAGGGPPSGADPTAAVERFLSFYPLLRFFCVLADSQMPSTDTPQQRVDALRLRAPWLYGLCVGVDVLLVVSAALIILGSVGITLYQALYAN